MRYTIYALFTMSLFFASCQELEEPSRNMPEVKTLEADPIGAMTARIHGEVTSLKAQKCTLYFLVSPEDNLAPDADKENENITRYYLDQTNPEETVLVQADVDGLSPGTTYYYALFATNEYTTVQGETLTVTTLVKTDITGRYITTVDLMKMVDNEPVVSGSNHLYLKITKVDGNFPYRIEFENVFPTLKGSINKAGYLVIDAELNGLHALINPEEKGDLVYGRKLCCSKVAEPYWGLYAGENTENWTIMINDHGKLSYTYPHFYIGNCYKEKTGYSCYLYGDSYYQIPTESQFEYLGE